MLESSLAPYLYWAKTRRPAVIDLAGSNLVACTMDDLPGAREIVDLTAPNDNGYPPLVEAIAAHYGVATDRVVTAAGCSAANFLAIAALAGSGDEVLIEQPTYDPLIGACRLMGATIVRYERRFEDGYRIDVDDLATRMTPRTRLIVLTTPHNPSGVRIDRGTLADLSRRAAARGAHVLVDEVYLDAAARVRDEDPTAPSGAAIDGPLVITNSLTKSYGLAGLRCGWVIADARTAERVRRTRDLVDNIGCAPGDRLGAFAFARLDPLGARARGLLARNLEQAAQFFAARSDVELAGPPISSVVFPRLRGSADSALLVRDLLERHEVAVAPGAFFDAPAHFRLSLAGRPEALERGLERLGKALDALGRG